MNQPKDTASGDFTRRIDALKRQVPRLSWVYVDAYFDTDWDAYKVALSINRLGWGMYTEFPDYAWPYVLWYHDTNEYGDQGVNSTIMRFLYNSDTDT